MHTLKIKRVYLAPEKGDGYRILVDRLWPRGLTKEKAAADLWLKEVAPSTTLRKWFNHDPEKWSEFQKLYYEELKPQKEGLDLILKKLKTQTVTLLFGAKNEEQNHAIALKKYLEKKTFNS